MKISGMVLKVLFIVFSMLYALLSILASSISALIGIAFSLADGIGMLFNGMDGTFNENSFSILGFIISVLIFVISLAIPVTSACTLFFDNSEQYKKCKILYIVTCGLAGLTDFFALLVCISLRNVHRVYNVNPFFEWKHFLWPVIGAVFLIAVILLTVFNLKTIKKEYELPLFIR